ncbi:hypothetical protein MGG_08018 [Pyricularia oryzae 70-15]|uniref:Uncharacterized protein n=1 Tax=Pyricularia oryzae (strain 70-15 / ATCC MYA-4617 / FGSC 8958) TaxID=242507 RepID=G4MX65_PYRO7|nr:uncharacterized protein MGG_08018 [Pyricularia oryzae 70-15]EHA55163.1 hypothetical protein MGG_08018 [Pyricularia oryzae 70-15]
MRDQGARMGREEAKPTKELSSSLTVDATLGYGRGERNEICTIHHYYLWSSALRPIGGTFWPLGTLEAETSAPPFWTCMSLCENRCLEA